MFSLRDPWFCEILGSRNVALFLSYRRRPEADRTGHRSLPSRAARREMGQLRGRARELFVKVRVVDLCQLTHKQLAPLHFILCDGAATNSRRQLRGLHRNYVALPAIRLSCFQCNISNAICSPAQLPIFC